MRLAYRVGLVLLVVLLAFAVPLAAAAIDQRQQREHVYDLAFGSVLCGHIERTHCGITLYDCHDGAIYRCMLNVRERE